MGMSQNLESLTCAQKYVALIAGNALPLGFGTLGQEFATIGTYTLNPKSYHMPG